MPLGPAVQGSGRRLRPAPWWKPNGQPPDPDLAGEFYRKSLEKYDEAYRIRVGHYPGINKATLLADPRVRSSRQQAGATPRHEVGKAQELAGSS